MMFVLWAALGVGGATVVGSLLGLPLRRMPQSVSNLAVGGAGGMMLAAAVWGLIIPSLGEGSAGETLLTACGVFFGAIFVGFFERFMPKLRFAAGEGGKDGSADGALTLLFAMAVHNFPEGLAVGVSLGSENRAGAISVALGIAIQNIPEGMAVIPPMLSAGISRRRAFALALFTGFVEVLGAFCGYRAITFFSFLLPVLPPFAGGAMIYVVVREMIPTASSEGKLGAYLFTVGVCAMLLFNLAV